MDNLLKDIKNIYGTYFLLIAVIIFVVIYVILNFEKVKNDVLSGDVVKPILITGIILLLTSLFLTDEQEYDFENEFKQPKLFKIINENNYFDEMDKLEKVQDRHELSQIRETIENNSRPTISNTKGKVFQIMNDSKNNKYSSSKNENHSKVETQNHSKVETQNLNGGFKIEYKNKKDFFLPYKNKKNEKPKFGLNFN